MAANLLQISPFLLSTNWGEAFLTPKSMANFELFPPNMFELIKKPFYFHLFPPFTDIFIVKKFYWLKKGRESELCWEVLEKKAFWSDVFLGIFWNCHNYPTNFHFTLHNLWNRRNLIYFTWKRGSINASQNLLSISKTTW